MIAPGAAAFVSDAAVLANRAEDAENHRVLRLFLAGCSALVATRPIPVGGNAIYDGPHLLNLAVWLRGRPPVRVVARGFPGWAADMLSPVSILMTVRFDDDLLGFLNLLCAEEFGRCPAMHRVLQQSGHTHTGQRLRADGIPGRTNRCTSFDRWADWGTAPAPGRHTLRKRSDSAYERPLGGGLGLDRHPRVARRVTRHLSSRGGSMAARLGVGLPSGVQHAGHCVRLLAAYPKVEPLEVADATDDAEWIIVDSNAVAASLGLPFNSGIEGFFDTANLDEAVVYGEPSRHAALAIAALDQGINTPVGKPVTTTIDDALMVARAAGTRGSHYSVIHPNYSPAIQRLRWWLDDGSLGSPRGAEALNFFGHRVVAIHMLTGLEVVDAYQEMATLFEFGHARHGIEDSPVKLEALERGVTATATVGSTTAAAGLNLGSSSFRLIGSEGHATANNDESQFAADRTVSTHAVGSGGGAAALAELLDDFLDSMIDASEARATARDAVTTWSVIDAAYQSSCDGSSIRVARAERGAQ